MLDYEAAKEASTKSKNTERVSYQKYSAENGFKLGKHSGTGTGSTLKKWYGMVW